MTNISTSAPLVTLINVFTVEPADQDQLVDLLTRATDETMCQLPGFVSANIHKSADGTRVTNYAQWRSREDFEAMLHNPAAMPHLKEATALATHVDPHLYEVTAVRNRRRSPERMPVRAAALGAVALGACAFGALAVGRLAIGALAIRRARIRRLSIDELEIGRLDVRELVSQPR